jgi:hypothetical protein
MQWPTLVFSHKPLKLGCTDTSRNFGKAAYKIAKFTWKEDYNAVMTRKKKYKENKSNAWALFYNQCLPKLKNKLEGASGYKNCNKDNNVVLLLTMIREYCCQSDMHNN